MHPFHYSKATAESEALRFGQASMSRWLAGGTTLVDLMRLEVETPSQVVDINALKWSGVRASGNELRLGALARNSEVAYHPTVKSRVPVLSEALLSGASPQVRNMASVGGNILQRTRCAYFRDVASPCNKRQPGQGCGAREGYNRMHAIFGASEQCVAVHPSDMCVALAVLDATVHVTGPQGRRTLPFLEVHTLPGDHPERDSVLGPEELITEVRIPLSPLARHSTYLKVRDRSAFAFALVSVAAAWRVQHGRIEEARLALGGVAHKPWRSEAAEKALTGQHVNDDTFRQAAKAAVAGAAPLAHNGFKVAMAERAVVEALRELARREEA